MTNDKIQEILNRLEGMEVKLNADPVPLGPAYIHKTLVATSDYLQEVSKFLVDIFKEEMSLQKKLTIQTQKYDFELREKLANDPEVRKQKASVDRDAVARNLLKYMETEINQTKLDLLDLEHLKRIVEKKNQDLRRTNSDIRLQHSTIQSALKLGVDWPVTDESDYENVTIPKKPQKKAVDEIEEGVFAALEPKPTALVEPAKPTVIKAPQTIEEVVAQAPKGQKEKKKKEEPKKEEVKIQVTKEVHNDDVFNVEDILGEIDAR